MNEEFDALTAERRRKLGQVELHGAITAEDHAVFAGMWSRQTDLMRLYEMAKSADGLYGPRGIVQASWRCVKHRCLLLDVFRVPEIGLATFKSGMKLSESKNAHTSPDARKKRTVDGNRRWVATSDVLADWCNYRLSCDHVHNHVVSGAEVLEAAERHAGIILV